jgi:hypothetical protein
MAKISLWLKITKKLQYLFYTLWQVSTAVCKWQRLAHLNLSQFMYPNIYIFNNIYNFSVGNQQMALIVCQWVKMLCVTKAKERLTNELRIGNNIAPFVRNPFHK